MARAKEACDGATSGSAKVVTTMTSQTLCEVAHNKHAPLLERAERAGVTDSPEYQTLHREQERALGMANSKDELAAAAKVSVGAQASLQQTNEACQRLEATIEEAKARGADRAPEFPACDEKLRQAQQILRLEKMVVEAADDGTAKMSVRQLRGEVITKMERAREAARGGNAYGGGVAQKLEDKLRAITEMANTKEKVASKVAASVSLQVPLKSLKEEMQRMQDVQSEFAVVATDSPEVQYLTTLIREMQDAANAKEQAQTTLGAAQKLLDSDPKKTDTVSFIGEKIENCEDVEVVEPGNSSHVIMPTKHGTTQRRMVQCGTDEEGRPKYETGPKEVRVRAEMCVVAPANNLKSQQDAVEKALKRMQGLRPDKLGNGCKLRGGGKANEIDELEEMKELL